MRLLFEKQLRHYILLAVLLAAVIAVSRREGFAAGSVGGVSTATWLCLALAAAVGHQIYVWFCWRTQLHSSLVTRILGKNAFHYYAAGFIFFMLFRGSMILLLAIANRNTLDIERLLLTVLAVVIAVPVLYVHYSVVRHFGFRRAMGIDHFDPSYRGAPLVKKGIFRFTNNAIYTYGLLVLWIPGLAFGSRATLLAALFHHIYIWVHYYTTEKPDMARIYGTAKNNRPA